MQPAPQDDVALGRLAIDHAIADVPVMAPSTPVAEAQRELASGSFAWTRDVIVAANGKVVGLLTAADLVRAAGETPVSDLMDADPITMAPGSDLASVAHRLDAHRQSALVVLGESGELRGLVPASALVGVLLDEHAEDMARIGGYVAGSDRARRAAHESVRDRLVHRLPWLLLGLAGAMASAIIVGAFEHRLDQNIVVALFVPAVVYMADAVGTQTEAVLIRALSVGVSIRSMVARELATGLFVGCAVGVAFGLFAVAGWGDERLAVAVALALFASCTIATVLAMALPALFQRLGSDPAFGSGPLATVAQDLLSIAVYLGVVVLIGA